MMRFCSAVLPNPNPGSTIMLRSFTRASSAFLTDILRELNMSSISDTYSVLSCMSTGREGVCIRTIPAPCSEAASAIP